MGEGWYYGGGVICNGGGGWCCIRIKLFLSGRYFVIFVVGVGKQNTIIDVIGSSDGSCISILWWVDKVDCRGYWLFLKSSGIGC